MAIVEATLDNLDMLLSLAQQMPRNTWTEHHYRAYLSNPRGKGWMNVDGTEVKGFILVAVMPAYSHLTQLHISDNYRNNYLGGLLIRRALAQVRALSPAPLIAQMDCNHEYLHHITSLQGAQITNTLPDYYGNGLHAYEITLDLDKVLRCV